MGPGRTPYGIPAQHGRLGGLPQGHVAHLRRRARQVRANRCHAGVGGVTHRSGAAAGAHCRCSGEGTRTEKVERGDGRDKALQRPILHAVPRARAVARRLHLVDLLGWKNSKCPKRASVQRKHSFFGVECASVRTVERVEPPKVAQLHGRINLGLPRVLARPCHRACPRWARLSGTHRCRKGLHPNARPRTQHDGGAHVGAVLGRGQVGGLEEDGDAVLERHGCGCFGGTAL